MSVLLLHWRKLGNVQGARTRMQSYDWKVIICASFNDDVEQTQQLCIYQMLRAQKPLKHVVPSESENSLVFPFAPQIAANSFQKTKQADREKTNQTDCQKFCVFHSISPHISETLWADSAKLFNIVLQFWDSIEKHPSKAFCLLFFRSQRWTGKHCPMLWRLMIELQWLNWQKLDFSSRYPSSGKQSKLKACRIVCKGDLIKFSTLLSAVLILSPQRHG